VKIAPDGRALPVLSGGLWLEGTPFDPSVVTDRVGIQPTISYRTGDAWRAGQLRRRDAWAVCVGPRPGLALQPLLEELIEPLEAQRDRIHAVCVELELTPRIYCPLELKSTLTPTIRLLPRTLQWIAELGALVDIDVLAWDRPDADAADPARAN
jgi:hypothetical protein